MKINKLISLSLSLCIVSGSAYATGADLKSSKVNIEGGNIAPTQSWAIDMSKLIPGAKYQIACHITYPNYKANPVTLILYS